MARNRVIYQSEAVYIGAAEGGAAQNIKRVQSCNYNFSIERQDLNQFGELAAIDRIILQEPTVNVDLTYFLDTDSASNENTFGFSQSPQHVLSGIIADTGDSSVNIIIGTSPPGVDHLMSGVMPASGWIAIGNAYLTSWSLEASVGAVPTVTCAFEGQNIAFTTAVVNNPSFDTGGSVIGGSIMPTSFAAFDSGLSVSAVKPGDVSISLKRTLSDANPDSTPGLGINESDLKIQSATIALTMSREPLRRLGKRMAFSRELTFPITCTFSVNAVIGEAVAGSLAAMYTGVNGDSTTYDCVMNLTGYVGSTSSVRTFALKKAKLNSQNITSSIGPNKMVTLELSAQIGKDSGLFMSPNNTY